MQSAVRGKRQLKQISKEAKNGLKKEADRQIDPQGRLSLFKRGIGKKCY
jgi:hypothetical protein